jgi:glycosyltransferase involved in cell wall biosynthesis
LPRVLLVCEPPDGGTTEVVAALARGLPGHGWEVEIAGPAHGARYAELEDAGLPVHRLPLVPGYGSPRADAAALSTLTRLLAGRRFDLVHTHSAKAGVLGRLAAAARRVPLVHSPHCFPFLTLGYSPRRRALAAGIERALAPLARRIVCVCEDERRQALTRRVARDDRLRVVYNGVPECGPAEPPAALAALAAGGPLAATVSVLRDQKRVDVFVDAAPAILAAVPDARLAVVGNGPLRDELGRRAARVGLAADPRFAFVDFTPPAAAVLAALDVYVLSSGYEAFPVGVLEALACGVPQVATRVGGTPEAVTAETGRLVAPGDPDALADAVIALLRDETARRAMGDASRRRHAEHFGVEPMVAGTAAVYAEALRA